MLAFEVKGWRLMLSLALQSWYPLVLDACDVCFFHAYPEQLVALKLGNASNITIDGRVDEEAWEEVPYTTNNFSDLAQLLHPGYEMPPQYATKVKVRWDAEFLYVAASLDEPYVTGAVTGHNPSLRSSNPLGNVPYYDNDFEVFIDAAGSNHFYKEFEMNYKSATYDVLWRAPDGGLGSVGVPCCPDDSCPRWCQNSSYPAFHGNWSMYPRLQAATSKSEAGWYAEVAFPLYAGAGSGGLLDGEPDPQRFDPNFGARYWLADFSRAEHPFFTSNASNLHVLCPIIQKAQPTLLGTDQWSCYWEWAWQHVGGFRYMHNPDAWGFVQFEETTDASLCKNAQWPVRYILAQVYQIEVAHVIATGSYSTDLSMLVNEYCTVNRTCNATDMRTALSHQGQDFNVTVEVQTDATTCVRYESPAAPTGGPCFLATAQAKLPVSGYIIQGNITEDRHLQLDALSAQAPCLDDESVVGGDELIGEFWSMSVLTRVGIQGTYLM